ncbi:MAG: ABC transporter ATP-binding protein [Asgard group archaeon]|nr:ABC transporter ATP-binding protein [Asgard group archaeon]
MALTGLPNSFFDAVAEEKDKKEKVSDLKLIRWSFSYLKEHKLLVFVTILFIITSSVVALASPQLIRYIIDDAFGVNPTSVGDSTLLLYLTLGLLSVTILTAVIQIFKTIGLNNLGLRAIRDIRDDAFGKLQSFSLDFFDNNEAGRIISKVTNDCDRINELISGGFVAAFTDFLTLVGIVIMMLFMNWQLALISLGLAIPLVLIFIFVIRSRARKIYRKTRQTIAILTANLTESISGVRISKSFSREGKNIEEFTNLLDQDKAANLKAELIFALMFPIINFISSVVMAFIYFFSGWIINNPSSAIFSGLLIGTAIAFTQYIANFFQPFLNLTLFYNTFQSTMAATERIYDLMHIKPQVIEKEDAYVLREILGLVRFEKVTFGYNDEELILDDFNLDVKPGERIAIVGPTGAGKTTIINLLSRFYEIQEGAIYIDDHNIQDITLHSLHSQMGIVLQDPYLFSGSIRKNICYGKESVSEDELIAVAKTVNAYDFIQELPQGFETQVGERGSRLSFGQRQLISFARALLDNPKILILDEATSSVDPHTELLIKSTLDNLLVDKTSIIIAHRLSTVQNADRIIVLKDGRIVEEGTNNELLQKKGEYFHLYQLQFKEQE